MIYLCCALTIALELLFFAFTPYWRRRYFPLFCAAVNAATNLSLNLILGTIPDIQGRPAVVLALEVLVVLTEYGVYAAAYGRARALLLLTLCANLLSFLTGVLLFGI